MLITKNSRLLQIIAFYDFFTSFPSFPANLFRSSRKSRYAVFRLDRELMFTIITRCILSQIHNKIVNTSRELVILVTTSIFVTNEINWRETTETK